MIRPVRRLKKGIGERDIGNAQPSELLDEPILMRAVVPLDAALGLRRARWDDRDPQRGAHAAKLRQRRGAGLTLLRIRHPDIDVFPIGIERPWNPVPIDPRPQQPDFVRRQPLPHEDQK